MAGNGDLRARNSPHRRSPRTPPGTRIAVGLLSSEPSNVPHAKRHTTNPTGLFKLSAQKRAVGFLRVLLYISGDENDCTVRREQSVLLNVRRKLRAIDGAHGAGCAASNEHGSDENAIGRNVSELLS